MTAGLLATDVSRFLRYLGVERQLSPITLLNYQRQLDAIMQIADEIGLIRADTKLAQQVLPQSGAKISVD